MPDLIGYWQDLDELRAFAARDRPWLIVESTEDGIAIGPLFGGDHGACFGCYLRRRAAAGATDLSPLRPGPLPELFRAAVGEVLTRLHDPAAAQSRYRVYADGRRRSERLLPFPGCERCEVSGPWEPAPASPEAAVGADIGIIARIESWPTEVPGVTIRHAIGSRTDLAGAVRALNHGAAADYDPARADLRATAEALERYAAAFPPCQMPLARHDQLDGFVLRPANGFANVGDDAPCFRWVPGQRLNSEQPVWLAAVTVFIPYEPSEDEAPVATLTTCGLAAGADLRFAIRHAAGELVERDAFMRAWRLGVPVERVESGLPELPGLHVFRLPTSAPLHVVAAFIERAEPPFTAVGLGTDTELALAAKAATLEAISVRAGLLRWLAAGGSRPADRPRTLEEHACLHAVEPSLLSARKRWIDTPLRISIDAPRGDWTRTLAVLPDAGWVEVTTPDVAALGLHVVRAVAPSLIPLETDASRPLLVGANDAPHPLA